VAGSYHARVTTFQRARSQEQRDVRRRAILDTTAAMLEVMPVAEVSLNELSRRVGMAKSNVLRYFDSREAILLELLDRASGQWLAELSDLLADLDPRRPAGERGDRLAALVAASLTGRDVLCDLLGAQAGVLEHNVSVEAAVRYKRALHAHLTALADLVGSCLPELDEQTRWKVTGLATVTVGALWTQCHPSPVVLAAYQADPVLAALRLPFAEAVEEAVALIVAGALARSRCCGPTS